jgi:hypothetical protein
MTDVLSPKELKLLDAYFTREDAIEAAWAVVDRASVPLEAQEILWQR